MSKTKEEKAREYAKSICVEDLGGNNLTRGDILNHRRARVADAYLVGFDSTASEIAELKEQLTILKTALEVIAESNPISIGLDEVEDLANNALEAYRLLNDKPELK